ncbi:flagellar hook-length control protein FliK [Halalkalibacter krulwichiae]|uniref:Flagellar hook-length control protein FliK n=1 Tax=Halalkalibacter krulwichiae TaxID=199441 RepID=A0A1X9MC64_9BACI|nr:flagellar hook-length control protein FliK [Halalkalibacter krulwichiae]ARK30996.1 Flagellar hook-length control protein FliK [Halalkalibacter krulwichiae]
MTDTAIYIGTSGSSSLIRVNNPTKVESDRSFAQILGQETAVSKRDGPSEFEEKTTSLSEFLNELIQLNQEMDDISFEADEEITSLLQILAPELDDIIHNVLQSPVSDNEGVHTLSDVGQFILSMIVSSKVSQNTHSHSHTEKMDLSIALSGLSNKVLGIDLSDTNSTKEIIQQFRLFMERNQPKEQLLDSQENNKSLLDLKLSVSDPLPSNIVKNHSNGHEVGHLQLKTEQAVMYIGDRLPKEVQAQQFLRQFHSFLKRGVFTQNQGNMNTFTIKLFPAHLGRLHIHLTQLDGSITAQITTGNHAVRDLIESQITQLRQAFIQLQLQVDRIEVTQQNLDEQKEREKESSSGGNEREEDAQDQDQLPVFHQLLEEARFNEEI